MEEILKFFPEILKEKIKQNLLDKAEEIRIRIGKPVILRNNQEEKVIDYLCTTDNILQILQKICDNSIYSYQNQICEGFLTLKGGHRVGITGNAVLKNGIVININHISSLNFRIARQILNCSDSALPLILDYEHNLVFNTLLISPPGLGKTTILRDIIRKVSNGIPEKGFKGITVGVADERGEIAASDRGMAQNDLGIRTDVIDNIPKAIGMRMLIRSMSPKVIVADEIGSKEDVESIGYAITSGVKGIFTAHGSNLQEIQGNPILEQLIVQDKIEKILLLDAKRNINLIYETKIEKRAG